MKKEEQVNLAIAISLFVKKLGEIESITKDDIEKARAFHNKIYSIFDEEKSKISAIDSFDNGLPKNDY